MLQKIGSTLVCSAITRDKEWQRKLIDAPQIDRLNIGAIPTIKLDWLQPHEGNIVEFLFRPRSFQAALEAVAGGKSDPVPAAYFPLQLTSGAAGPSQAVPI